MHLLPNKVGCLLGSQINKTILWPDSPVTLMECIRSDPLSPLTVLIKEPEIPWCATSVCVLLLKGHHASPWQLVITGAYGHLRLLPATAKPWRTIAELEATLTWISTVTPAVRRDVRCCPLRCLVEMRLRGGVSGDMHRWGQRMRKGEKWGRESESRACVTEALWAPFQIQIALKVKMIPSHLKTAALSSLRALRDSAPPCALCDLSPRAGIIISEWLIKNNWGPERFAVFFKVRGLYKWQGWE